MIELLIENLSLIKKTKHNERYISVLQIMLKSKFLVNNNNRDTNGSPNLGQTTRCSNNPQNFTVSVDHRVKLKENEKKNKYLNLAQEWKKL